MLFHMKDQKAAVLENDLNKLQKDGPAAWAELPEDELFTPAGFRAEQAEATAYSNYSYWGSTFRAFFKNKVAVALLIALVAVVAFAFLQPQPARSGGPEPVRSGPRDAASSTATSPPASRASSGVPTPSDRIFGPASGPVPAPV